MMEKINFPILFPNYFLYGSQSFYISMCLSVVSFSVLFYEWIINCSSIALNNSQVASKNVFLSIKIGLQWKSSYTELKSFRPQLQIFCIEFYLVFIQFFILKNFKCVEKLKKNSSNGGSHTHQLDVPVVNILLHLFYLSLCICFLWVW